MVLFLYFLTKFLYVNIFFSILFFFSRILFSIRSFHIFILHYYFFLYLICFFIISFFWDIEFHFFFLKDRCVSLTLMYFFEASFFYLILYGINTYIAPFAQSFLLFILLFFIRLFPYDPFSFLWSDICVFFYILCFFLFVFFCVSLFLSQYYLFNFLSWKSFFYIESYFFPRKLQASFLERFLRIDLNLFGFLPFFLYCILGRILVEFFRHFNFNFFELFLSFVIISLSIFFLMYVLIIRIRRYYYEFYRIMIESSLYFWDSFLTRSFWYVLVFYTKSLYLEVFKFCVFILSFHLILFVFHYIFLFNYPFWDILYFSYEGFFFILLCIKIALLIFRQWRSFLFKST
uniref:SecY-type transporter protein n=1 Tax=Jakoba bahamiensis TaxID=221721 RepID=M4QC68_9EUKA|nr:SecY-type transporter protein [Jakoba bahamiensis]AGH24164.1 SecY-type transporter protein [Jakoba bahamiensis]